MEFEKNSKEDKQIPNPKEKEDPKKGSKLKQKKVATFYL